MPPESSRIPVRALQSSFESPLCNGNTRYQLPVKSVFSSCDISRLAKARQTNDTVSLTAGACLNLKARLSGQERVAHQHQGLPIEILSGSAHVPDWQG